MCPRSPRSEALALGAFCSRRGRSPSCAPPAKAWRQPTTETGPPRSEAGEHLSCAQRNRRSDLNSGLWCRQISHRSSASVRTDASAEHGHVRGQCRWCAYRYPVLHVPGTTPGRAGRTVMGSLGVSLPVASPTPLCSPASEALPLWLTFRRGATS